MEKRCGLSWAIRHHPQGLTAHLTGSCQQRPASQEGHKQCSLTDKKEKERQKLRIRRQFVSNELKNKQEKKNVEIYVLAVLKQDKRRQDVCIQKALRWRHRQVGGWGEGTCLTIFQQGQLYRGLSGELDRHKRNEITSNPGAELEYIYIPNDKT